MNYSRFILKILEKVAYRNRCHSLISFLVFHFQRARWYITFEDPCGFLMLLFSPSRLATSRVHSSYRLFNGYFWYRSMMQIRLYHLIKKDTPFVLKHKATIKNIFFISTRPLSFCIPSQDLRLIFFEKSNQISLIKFLEKSINKYDILYFIIYLMILIIYFTC
jgi:hypothetical protein